MAKDKRPVKLWTCDTETRGLFGEVFRIGLYDGEEYNAYYNFNEVIEKVREYAEYQNHIYIHNLEFDLAKVAPEIFNQSSIIWSESIFINNSVATVTTDDFVLHDSYKLLTASLEKLCKDFDLQELSKKDLTEHLKDEGYKDKTDYFNRVSPDEPMLNEYLKYDCISLYTLLEKVMTICVIDAETLIKCPTTASLSMSIFKTRYSEHFEEATKFKFNGEWGKFLEEFIRLSYYGGRTEVFKPFIKNGYHYDVNSLYPYVMKTYDFPVGFPEYMEGKDAERIYKMWERRGIGAGFLYCDIFVPDMHIPPLPKRDKTGKLLFPVGKLTGVWSFPEVAKALQMGCELVTINSCVYFKKTAPLFKEFIHHFEQVKTHSKGAKRALAKLIQNSLYGKFGMIRRRRTFVDISQLDKLITDETPYMIHEYNYNMQGVKFIETVVESRAQYIQPQISSYITAYARLELLDGLLHQQERGEVAYCDTDSIASTAIMDADKVHDTEYGKWKLESVIDEGVFLQPKLYAEKNAGGGQTIRAKGIPKEIMAGLTYDSYINWYEIIKGQEQEVINIFNDYKARMKFITMLKNNLDLNTVNFISKSIHITAMQKRQIDYNANKTKPHTIEAYGDVLADSFVYSSKYTKLLENVSGDSDSIEELINVYGFIKPPVKGDSYYQLYKTLPQNAKVLYFGFNGQPLIEWCEMTGRHPRELLLEMIAERE